MNQTFCDIIMPIGYKYHQSDGTPNPNELFNDDEIKTEWIEVETVCTGKIWSRIK